MSNDYFQFKKFRINQDRCSMKVGTDGVLLGAWVGVDSATEILEVGTGTGLIPLMLAQRNPNCHIDTIEIESQAYHQAVQNVKDSEYHEQITLIQDDFCLYQSDKKYDLVVSNPPFFSTGTQSDNPHRNIARHTISLDYQTLISRAANMLTSKGVIALILPYSQLTQTTYYAQMAGLSCKKKCLVIPTPDKPCKRVLIAFSKSSKGPIEEKLTLEISRHVYSPAAEKLLKEFYLKL